MKEKRTKLFSTLNQRSLDIFKYVVDAYIATGEPIGSRTLAQQLGMRLSSATIRNTMAQLEDAGLLYAPHTSAGRLPTDIGLKFFVHGLLEVGDLPKKDRTWVEDECGTHGFTMEKVLDQASRTLSGLSQCAGLVIAPKHQTALKHVEFVHLEPGRALAVMVTDDGNIENRILEVPRGLPPSSLVEATNYINGRFAGYSLEEVRANIEDEAEKHQNALGDAAQALVQKGIATWVNKGKDANLILNGQSNLISSAQDIEDLTLIKEIFALLDTKKGVLDLLDASISGDGVQIFIGAENDLFEVTGGSVIMAPYKNAEGKMIGALGVIGPSRINYSRIIPLVDYTAKVVGSMFNEALEV